MGLHEASVGGKEQSPGVAGTIHLPDAAEGLGGVTQGEEKGVGWIIPYCATAPPSDAQECCTQRSFWLCPCCYWARCL